MRFVADSANSPRQKERVVQAARVPITGAGMTALRRVERYQPITVSALAQRLGLDLSTVSRQLRPLEKKDLVRRASDSDDRRVAALSVTRKGRELLGRVTAAVLADFDAALADWSPADRSELATLLDRFRDRLSMLRAAEVADSHGSPLKSSPG